MSGSALPASANGAAGWQLPKIVVEPALGERREALVEPRGVPLVVADEAVPPLVRDLVRDGPVLRDGHHELRVLLAAEDGEGALDDVDLRRPQRPEAL